MTTLLVLLCQSTALLSLGLLALRLTRRFGPSVQTLIGQASFGGVALLLLFAPLTGHVRPVVQVKPPQRVQEATSQQEPTPLQAATLPIRNNAEGHKREGGELPPPSSPLHFDEGQFWEATQKDAVQKDAVRIGNRREGAASSTPTISALATPAPRPPAPGGPLFAEPQQRGEPLRSNLLYTVIAQVIRSKEVGFSLAVSFALLLWLGVCQFHLTRLRRAAHPITDGPAAALLAELTPSPPALLTHPSVHSPFLAGIRRPAIFLPPTFAADFAPDALRAVFLHELAHRDRRDNLWTLITRVLTAILWFQPLLWLLARKLEQISEDACDQAVLAAHCPPRAYAACLLSLAERPPLTRSQRTLTAGVAPFRSSVGRRITHILASKGVRPMPPLTLRLRLTAAALTLAAALGGAFLVSSAPAQTAASAPAKVAPSSVTTASSTTQTILGYGLQNYVVSHKRYCRAILGSVAARAGIPTGKASVVLAVNGRSHPLSDAHFYTLIRSSPPLRLTLQTPDKQTRQFTLLKKEPFSITTGTSTVTTEAFRLAQEKLANQMIRAAQLRQLTQELTNRLGRTPITNNSNNPLGQARFLAGLTPVQGPGVVVTLTDSKKAFPAPMPAGAQLPNLIHDTDINQVINELRAAGAEAIAVNNQRLVAISAVRSAGPTIYVNNTLLAAPFVIQAIGDPQTLVGALNIPGGEASQIKVHDKAMFTIQQAATLTLPAYSGGSEPRYTKPVGETAEAVDAPIQEKLDFLRRTEESMQAWRAVQPKRTFQVNFQTPANGPHAIRVFVHDVAGQRLVLSKVYQQRTPVSLPVAADGESVSFQIFDNGRLTKEQQMTGGPALATDMAQAPTATDSRTVVGYGLISSMHGKLLYCRAVKGSAASRLGLLTDRGYQVFGVNGKPVPQSIAQFAEICHAAPPLRLLLRPVLLKNFHGWKSHLVVFPAKSAYLPPSNLVTEESSAKYVQTAQEEAAKSKAMRGQIIQQLTDLVAAALPQADAQTRAKAFNLEKHIGWSEDRNEFGKEYLAWRRKKRKIKSTAMTSALGANAQSYLNPDLAEEAKIFPKTADTNQNLHRMHKLARQIGNMNMTVMEKQDLAQVITSLARERSPDMSL